MLRTGHVTAQTGTFTQNLHTQNRTEKNLDIDAQSSYNINYIHLKPAHEKQDRYCLKTDNLTAMHCLIVALKDLTAMHSLVVAFKILISMHSLVMISTRFIQNLHSQNRTDTASKRP